MAPELEHHEFCKAVVIMDQRKGIVLATVTVLLWSTLGIGFKTAVSRLDSLEVTLYVGIITTLGLAAYLAFRGKLFRVRAEFQRHPLVGAGSHVPYRWSSPPRTWSASRPRNAFIPLRKYRPIQPPHS